MKTILDALLHSNSRDVELVFEFLSHSFLFENSSQRVPILRIRAEHYRTLKQPAAKENQWRKIYDILYGLTIELDSLRRRRERGGTGVQ